MTQQQSAEHSHAESDSERPNLDAERRSAPVGGSIALLILAIFFGAGSLILVVFGAWPAVVLLIACALAAWLAIKNIKKNKPESMQ